jgi:hypothetical protein
MRVQGKHRGNCHLKPSLEGEGWVRVAGLRGLALACGSLPLTPALSPLGTVAKLSGC